MIEVFLPFSYPPSSLPPVPPPVSLQFPLLCPPSVSLQSPSRPRSRRFHRLSPEHKSFKKELNSLKLPYSPPKNLVISNKKCKFALNISTNNN